MKSLGLLFCTALLGSACATTRAELPIERPILEVPPPPPRVVEPTPQPNPPLELVGDLPPAPPAPSPAAKPRPSPPRDTKQTDTAKIDQKPAADSAPSPQPEPPVSTVASAPTNATPPALLRTPATADTAGAEREIRKRLDRARSGLNALNAGRLSGDRKKALAEAREYIDRAEGAMKASNFELAKELADKAEKYSKELQGR